MKEVVKKSVRINAPREKVWDILTKDDYQRIWYAEFSEGSHAETDWKPGSKVKFLDNTGMGLAGKILTNKPLEEISIEHEKAIIAGKEAPGESEKWKGCKETYRLSGENGTSLLVIEQEAPEEYSSMFVSEWEKALTKIKELAEK